MYRKNILSVFLIPFLTVCFVYSRTNAEKKQKTPRRQSVSKAKTIALSGAGVDEVLVKAVEALKQGVRIRGKIPAVAVLPFKDNSQKLKKNNTGAGFAQMLGVVWKKQTKHIVVSRADMKSLLSEMEMGLSGMADTREMLKVGHLVSAQYLISGELTEMGTEIIITCRLVSVNTGRIRRSARITINSSVMLPAAAAALLSPIKPITSAFRSLLVPGWGQFYNDHNIRGAVYTGLWAASILSVLYCELSRQQSYDSYLQSYNEYKTADNKSDTLDKWNNAEKEYDRALMFEDVRNYSIYAMAAITGSAVMDAVISAAVNNKKMKKHKIQSAFLLSPQKVSAQIAWSF
ncbi:MAG TPA: DUF5683 domain-containing protein [Spirochaetota bacterium]|nr:DUF5683 domain-containing protein [Spirochaetota bacterium]